MSEKDLLNKIEALEARVEKLEKALAGGAAKPAAAEREVIVAEKRTSGSWYYKTSTGRILQYVSSQTKGYPRNADGEYYDDKNGYSIMGFDSDYLTELRSLLLAIDAENMLDLDSNVNVVLDETPEYKSLMTTVGRLRAKFGAKGSFPALFPNDYCLGPDGQIERLKESQKAIKF